MSGKKMQIDRRERTSNNQEHLSWKENVQPLSCVAGVLRRDIREIKAEGNIHKKYKGNPKRHHVQELDGGYLRRVGKNH